MAVLQYRNPRLHLSRFLAVGNPHPKRFPCPGRLHLFCTGQFVRYLRQALPICCVLLYTSIHATSLWAAEDGANSAKIPMQPVQSVGSGEILVGLRTDIVRASALSEQLSLSLGPDLVHSVESMDTRGLGTVSCDDDSVPGLRISVQSGHEARIAELLSQREDVLFALPNLRVSIPSQIQVSQQAHNAQARKEEEQTGRLTPVEITDPLYEEQRWYMDQIRGEEALNHIMSLTDADASSSNGPVQVAIIDSGIDLDHPEFAGRLLPGYNYLQPSEPPEDDYGHGTHVAGLIGASVNNGLGIVGIAPNVVIAPYKTLDRFGNGSIDNVIRAICRAVDDGADIINLSLTASSQPEGRYASAFQYAVDHDVLMIAAAGNAFGNSNGLGHNMWPAELPEVMAVAATNVAGEVAYYSSSGDDLDMAAPGGEPEQPILSTWSSEAPLCSSKPESLEIEDNLYCNSIGTSMSAALVSGVAAVMLDLNPQGTAADIRELLVRTVSPLSDGPERIGSGLLDAEEAIIRSNRSNLVVDSFRDEGTIPFASGPFDVEIQFENPGLSPIEWQIYIPNKPWAAVSQTQGTTAFNEPGSTTITFLPELMDAGTYSVPVYIFGTKENDLKIYKTVQIRFEILAEPSATGLLHFAYGTLQSLKVPDKGDRATTTITFRNAGMETVGWEVSVRSEPAGNSNWIQSSTPLTGSLEFNQSTTIGFEIIPELTTSSVHTATIDLQTTHADHSQSLETTSLRFEFVPSVLLPLIATAPGMAPQ